MVLGIGPLRRGTTLLVLAALREHEEAGLEKARRSFYSSIAKEMLTVKASKKGNIKSLSSSS
jgi:hypothetical protein